VPQVREVSDGWSKDRSRHVGVAICVVGLAGMAYCHVKDLGMKLDEHVYYMAALFPPMEDQVVSGMRSG